ncbi:helix-turn-helix domain-containing protein [Streptomyces zagrosensis]|uniref:Transcriptional regulator with XRE-family HTH domain n=1 Tax=Streptomyces zagrosensis TaxID=1042984 RepID=A0A7W9UYX6_9ACTN|nr:helix-turn-helix transcriptional regulator [Streptomyces zagrosensis]MBB5936408.1 transcriptional regulator with XRE-family HTH domain [Streptomyces zagrosensis]
MRQALTDRNIATVFRHYRRHTGASQTRLGALTGLAQSNISAIERGVRHVTSAEVLDRITTGLGIPQHHLNRTPVQAPTPADTTTHGVPTGPPRACPEARPLSAQHPGHAPANPAGGSPALRRLGRAGLQSWAPHPPRYAISYTRYTGWMVLDGTAQLTYAAHSLHNVSGGESVSGEVRNDRDVHE